MKLYMDETIEKHKSRETKGFPNNLLGFKHFPYHKIKHIMLCKEFRAI